MMISLPQVLAQSVSPLDPTLLDVGKTSGMLLKDILMLVGVFAVLAGALFFLAVRYVRTRKGKRKRRRRHHRHHRHHHEESPETRDTPDPAEPSQVEPTPEHRHRHRRRHRRHRRRSSSPDRGRNPTLAETGGLPPARDHSPPSQPV